MKMLSQLVRATVQVALTPVAIVQDMVTLGGVVNDGYFKNGQRTYTGKRLADALEAVEEIGK